MSDLSITLLLIGALLAGSGTLRLPAFRRKAAG